MSSTTPRPSVSASASSASALSRSLASLASAIPSASSGGSTPATNSTPGEPIVVTQTPIFACVPASYNISGGTPPFKDVFLIQSGRFNAGVLKTLPHEDKAGTFSWGVDVTPGTSITFVVKDSVNQTGYSVPIVIQAHKDLSCLPKKKHTSNTGAIVGAIVGIVAAVLLLCAFLVWKRRSQSKRRRPLAAASNVAEESDEEVIEEGYGELKRVKTVKEAPTGVVRTLSSGHRTVMRSNTIQNRNQPVVHTRPQVDDQTAGEASTAANDGTFNLSGLAYHPRSLDAAPRGNPNDPVPDYR